MSSLVFLPAALCWWAKKNNNNNKHICMAPEGRNFGGVCHTPCVAWWRSGYSVGLATLPLVPPTRHSHHSSPPRTHSFTLSDNSRSSRRVKIDITSKDKQTPWADVSGDYSQECVIYNETGTDISLTVAYHHKFHN